MVPLESISFHYITLHLTFHFSRSHPASLVESHGFTQPHFLPLTVSPGLTFYLSRSHLALTCYLSWSHLLGTSHGLTWPHLLPLTVSPGLDHLLPLMVSPGLTCYISYVLSKPHLLPLFDILFLRWFLRPEFLVKLLKIRSVYSRHMALAVCIVSLWGHFMWAWTSCTLGEY